MKKSFADFVTERKERSQGITDLEVRKVERRRTEPLRPHLQVLALSKDHQGPLSLAVPPKDGT